MDQLAKRIADELWSGLKSGVLSKVGIDDVRSAIRVAIEGDKSLGVSLSDRILMDYLEARICRLLVTMVG